MRLPWFTKELEKRSKSELAILDAEEDVPADPAPRAIIRSKPKADPDTSRVHTDETRKTVARPRCTNERLHRQAAIMRAAYDGKCYVVVDPKGQVYNVQNMSRFCRDFNLPESTLCLSARDGTVIKRGKARGWRAHRVTVTID
jgi:hypothetical protein